MELFARKAWEGVAVEVVSKVKPEAAEEEVEEAIGTVLLRRKGLLEASDGSAMAPGCGCARSVRSGCGASVKTKRREERGEEEHEGKRQG